ncbi:MAG TPA: protease complex subunit PrcB family protein [Thermodesulfobacteriota bacterium]|nr:protease complex subunit PrcB family protein [Thermodesulfobacteriota bacterium]
MRTSLILAGFAAAAIAACIIVYVMSGTVPAAVSGQPSSEGTLVPAELLVAGAQSSVTDRVNYLITSSAEFGELWSLIQATGTMPAVDFSTHSVLAVFAGQEPTAGYAIGVSKVEDTSDGRKVTIALSKPGSDCVTAAVITTPFELVSVPKTTLPLSHEDAVATTSCTQ